MQQDNIKVAISGYDGAGLKVKVKGPQTDISNQHPSFYKASTKALLKDKPSKAAGTIVVRAISKQRIGQTQEEFRKQYEEKIFIRHLEV